MNASFIRERQRYSTVVTAGPLSTHMILFAISMWKNIFSSAGRARTKNELPTAKNLSWQGSAYISSVCGEIPNTPKVSKLFMHLASGYSHKTFIHKQRDVYGAARWEVYPSEIEAVGISPACVYVWIAKYVPLNKFQQIFCWDLFLLLHKLYTDTHEIQQTFFIKCTIRNFFETV